jgi:hypothetical protein
MSQVARFGTRPISKPKAEELETGEPITEEVEVEADAEMEAEGQGQGQGQGEQPGKIAALRRNFGGGPAKLSGTTSAPGGRIVLSSAKYLQRDPDGELRREQQRRDAERAARQEQKPPRSLEGILSNGGVVGGFFAMLVAVAWFVCGLLMLDTTFLYPPLLFGLGLVAVVRGFMKDE